ncbi:MAG: nucleoside diphosphate kinase regulator [Bacteroidetes bacterium]|nr:nucleoside diphosphate kinase regulator [Bacteroidota bacterium]
MNNRHIYITDSDMKRLRALVSSQEIQNNEYGRLLLNLKNELDRAVVVASEEIPNNIITMNSQIHLTDLDKDEEIVFTLVFPGKADFENNRISVLTPAGTAIIGCKVDDIIDFEVPSGRTRLRINKILFQPEAVGDFHL